MLEGSSGQHGPFFDVPKGLILLQEKKMYQSRSVFAVASSTVLSKRDERHPVINGSAESWTQRRWIEDYETRRTRDIGSRARDF